MSRDISKLSRFMQEKAIEFIKECNGESLDIVIICTDRSDEDQAKAFASKASNARPGESAHNAVDAHGFPASEAFDVGVIRNGKYIGDGSDPDYQKAGQIAEKIGLSWSGRWKGKLREVAHMQNPSWEKPKRKVA